MKLPFKVAIMQHFILNPDTSFDVNEILEAMKPVYGKERQCNPVRIDYYLRAMLNVNILETASIELVGEKDLDVRYKITNHGIEMKKYIPKKKENSYL